MSVDKVLNTPEETLNGLISKVSFHNTKTRHILAATRICKERHGGSTPRTMEDLLELPGVGPKMALIFMSVVRSIKRVYFFIYFFV